MYIKPIITEIYIKHINRKMKLKFQIIYKEFKVFLKIPTDQQYQLYS